MRIPKPHQSNYFPGFLEPHHSSNVAAPLSGICCNGSVLAFRIATQADVSLLASMNERLMRDEGNRSRLTQKSLEPRMSRWLAGDYRAAIFSLDGEPMGYALWKPKSDHVHLRQYYVEPAFRRKGYGKAGIKLLMNNAWGEFARVRLEVLVGNETGLSFWKSIGFEDYCVTMELQMGDDPRQEQ